MSSRSVTTVASVLRLLDALAAVADAASYAETVLPRLAEVVECDALSYGEVGPAGASRRLDHVVTAVGRAGDTPHRLGLTIVVPGPRLVGITLRRAGRGFTASERELLEVLRAPLAEGLRRLHRLPADLAMGTTQVTAGVALTAREHQVLELVALGRTNHAIAHALAISPRTVGKHLEHAYRKLAVTSRAAAVASLR